MNKCEIITQVLFQKFGDEFKWLTFPDLHKIVETKFGTELNENEISNIHAIRIISDKIHHILIKINDIKAVRKISNTIETDSYEQLIPKENSHVKKEITPVMSYKTHHVLIDSKDRNTDKWKLINPFQFTFGPSSINSFQTNDDSSVFRIFSNVHAVTIKTVIIPHIEHTFPYLLLEISELGPNLNSTNNSSNSSFGYLSKPSIWNNYEYFNFEESFDCIAQSNQNTHMTKIFSPRIELTRLTFTIRDPNGDVILFNEEENKSVTIELQVTCLRKELDNTIIIRPS